MRYTGYISFGKNVLRRAIYLSIGIYIYIFVVLLALWSPVLTMDSAFSVVSFLMVLFLCVEIFFVDIRMISTVLRIVLLLYLCTPRALLRGGVLGTVVPTTASRGMNNSAMP